MIKVKILKKKVKCEGHKVKNYRMSWKVMSQGMNLWNMKAQSLSIYKLWPRLKFLESRSNFQGQGHKVS